MSMHVRACGTCGVLTLQVTVAFGSRNSNHRELSNWYVAYTKQVGFGELALLDVREQQVNPPISFTCWTLCMLSNRHLAFGLKYRGIASIKIYLMSLT